MENQNVNEIYESAMNEINESSKNSYFKKFKSDNIDIIVSKKK